MECPIEIKDYWTIIALEACGHVPECIELERTDETRPGMLVYKFGEEAQCDYEKWMRGVNEEPLGVIRQVQQSARNFKINLNRFRYSK